MKIDDALGALEVFAAWICVNVASVSSSGHVVLELRKIHYVGGVRCGN